MTLLNKIIFLVSAYIIPSRLYAENEKGGMPQLDPSSYTSQTFWLILTFAILFIFVNLFFFPKIIKVKENREKKINDLLNNAKKNNEMSSNIKYKLEQDFDEALHWYTQSADQGHPLALRNIAKMYEKGIGVIPNPGLASQLYGTCVLAL